MSNGEQWNEAYANIDFCVHQQPHMTSTTIEDADLFLPMQEWLEFEHATETTTQFNQTFMRKQIVHMGETEDPFICVTRIVDSLCEKLGGDDAVLCRDFQFNGTYRTKEDIYPAGRRQDEQVQGQCGGPLYSGRDVRRGKLARGREALRGSHAHGAY